MPKSVSITMALACALLIGSALVQSGEGAPARIGAATKPVVASTNVSHAGEVHGEFMPLLKRYCFECHGDGASSGDLELDKYKTPQEITGNLKTFQKVIHYARTHIMPPTDAELQPTQDDRDALVEALQRTLYPLDPHDPDPGQVTIRRLNRVEYRNTVHDLIGVQFDPTSDFPEDDTGYGFDNIGDVLTLPPMLMEKYLAAAEKVLDQAINTDVIENRTRKLPATRASFSAQKLETIENEWVVLSSASEDSISVPIQSPLRADYLVRVLAYAKPTTQASTQPIKLSLMDDEAVAASIAVTTDEAHPQWYEARISAPPARQTIGVAALRERDVQDRFVVSGARVGTEQPGKIFVKEIEIQGPLQGAVRRVEREQFKTPGDLMKTGDEATANILVNNNAEHLTRFEASADFAGDEHAKIELRVDDKPIQIYEVNAPTRIKTTPGVKVLVDGADRAVPRIYETRMKLSPGKHQLAARYLNNFRDPDNKELNLRDRNVYVRHFEIVDLSSPPLRPPLPSPLRELFVKHAGPKAGDSSASIASDESTARAILEDFALRAWRRPPQSAQVDRLMKLYRLAHDNGESFHASVKHAMKGVLVSSSFLFRGEVSPARAGIKKGQPIGEYELASRLSYFLWSSMPDDELLDLARRGALRENLAAQTKRILASPKSQAFIENFAGQWLQFRNLDAVHPDDKLFEAYNDRLRDSMQKETQLFFDFIMREDRSLLDVLTADYTFVNERLAKHYGLPGVKGEEFQRVSLAGTPRRGVMTQGSVLTLTSNPTRTSPVKRGKWVLENLLGTPPPPPPPEIPPLDSETRKLTGTIRQRMEQHRVEERCASCHAPMDSVGFALENFDAVGAWREKDGKDPVDASSSFGDGAKFKGAAELANLLAKTRRKDFFRAVTEAALTFALGRGVEPYDQPAVDGIVRDLQQNDAKFSALILGVVNSVPFQMQRVQSAASATQVSVDGISD